MSKPWLVLQNGIQAVRIARLKRKICRQADEIDRLERSRVGLKRENAMLNKYLDDCD